MRAIKTKLIALGMPPRNAGEIAFNMGDVAEGLEQLVKFIRKASSRKKITRREVDRALDSLDFHVPYHIKELSKLVRRTQRLTEIKNHVRNSTKKGRAPRARPGA
jgi:hypothetical protein